jgi:hypothetical protein
MRRSKPTEKTENISGDEAGKLLNILCVKFGFCLSPLWTARLRNNPPRSVSRFADTVFRAEGLDPLTVESDLYRAIFTEVRKAFERTADSQQNSDNG